MTKLCSTPPRLHCSVLTVFSFTPISITSLRSLRNVQPINLVFGYNLCHQPQKKKQPPWKFSSVADYLTGIKTFCKNGPISYQGGTMLMNTQPPLQWNTLMKFCEVYTNHKPLHFFVKPIQSISTLDLGLSRMSGSLLYIHRDLNV